MIEYTFEVVGGPFDGVDLPAPAWADDGKHPCPALIFLGMCRQGACGSGRCRGRRITHVGYWLAEEPQRPADAHPYRLQREYVVRGEDDAGEETLKGRAVYAVGGLLDPRNFGTAARVPQASDPLVTASAPDLMGALRRAELSLPADRHERWPR